VLNEDLGLISIAAVMNADHSDSLLDHRLVQLPT